MNQFRTGPELFPMIVLDCDGVILNSNKIKTCAFRSVAQRYGPEAAEKLVDFHVQNGGVSRYQKFSHLLVNILGQSSDERTVRVLAEEYGALVYSSLLQCTIAPGIHKLRETMARHSWMVVSGGDEAELRSLFAARGLDLLFDRGIHGSPATKDEILQREMSSKNLVRPALFVGDSRYDHEAAKRAGLAFVFVSGWSEFLGWNSYCATHEIPVIDTLADLDLMKLPKTH